MVINSNPPLGHPSRAVPLNVLMSAFDALPPALRRAIREAPYLHAQCVPLSEVDLSTAAERGQADLFGNECEGMCGV